MHCSVSFATQYPVFSAGCTVAICSLTRAVSQCTSHRLMASPQPPASAAPFHLDALALHFAVDFLSLARWLTLRSWIGCAHVTMTYCSVRPTSPCRPPSIDSSFLLHPSMADQQKCNKPREKCSRCHAKGDESSRSLVYSMILIR
jgi:hypothetical protein